VGVIPSLFQMAIYATSDTCSGENQKANILKTVTNSYKPLVLSSKVGAHRSLISDRKSGHRVGGVSRAYSGHFKRVPCVSTIERLCCIYI
jgi:hypothetical protein